MKLDNQSILVFLANNRVVNEKKRLIEFDRFLFLIQPYTDWSKEQVYKKCSQVGISTMMIMKSTFAAKEWGLSSIHTLPTEDDVGEFVRAKTNKIYSANPIFSDLRTDNVEMKEIGDGFIYYKGTVSKSAAIMTTADILIHDEIDRSDQKVIEDFKSRTKGADSFGARWLLSNPTVDKAGVDVEWLRSDQKEWEIKCFKCNAWQILTWPDSINFEGKYFQCKGCQRPLTDAERAFGRWTPQNPGAPVSGYHFSHLMASWISAGEIMHDSEGDQEYFHNFVLGEPYNPGDLKVSRTTILDNWTPKKIETSQWYLGVDVGNIKHYVLGSEVGITQVGTFSEWHELDKILDFYKPATVIDAMPENTMSRYYVEHYQNVWMCFLGHDKNRTSMVKWGEGEDSGTIWADRNRLIDTVISDLIHGKVLFALPSDRQFRDYIRHWETLRRVKEINNIGVERYVWESTTSVDHFCFATLYYWLAVQTKGAGLFIPLGQKEKDTKLVDYVAKEGTVVPVMGDIKQMYDEGLWGN